MDARPQFPVTHEVSNQSPPFAGVNLYTSDPVLQQHVNENAGQWGESRLSEYGALAGGELMELGFLANENPPRLRSFDRYGHRIDEVDFHPAYHQLMRAAIRHEIPSLPWRETRSGAQVVRAGLGYLHGQVEAGSSCPLTMTYACVPALRHDQGLWSQWSERVLSREYDPRHIPALEKNGVTVGMGMTEKQGGSDVRSNTTRAWPLTAEGSSGEYELVGHKWFFSAPMCDAFLVLAQAPGGLSCFLLPRWRPDGQRNAIRIQRLKDKLGNHSNASSEVEFAGAWAQRLGPEGRGVATIIEMVAHTRLDCMIGSAALMRQALTQALHHARHRKAFGRALVEQPLMRNVLADLALESEAALALTLRVARAFDEAPDSTQAQSFARLATAVGKYWICKRAPAQVNEAQECLGGAGYVEESILPRLYREAPLNSIWEGSGNIQCLDALRAMSREPEALQAVVDELDSSRGMHELLDAAVNRLKSDLVPGAELEFRARKLVGQLARCLQASLLLQHAPEVVGEAFCQSRLSDDPGMVYGELSNAALAGPIIDRALGELSG